MDVDKFRRLDQEYRDTKPWYEHRPQTFTEFLLRKAWQEAKERAHKETHRMSPEEAMGPVIVQYVPWMKGDTRALDILCQFPARYYHMYEDIP